MPLTPNGKLDKRALIALYRQYVAQSVGVAAPKNALEVTLAKIWAEVLGLEKVGVRDNFFDHGGHSMLALRLFAGIHTALGKDLPLATIFSVPTVEKMAAILEKDGWESPWKSLVAIKTAGHLRPFYCVHGVGGNVLNYKHLADRLDASQPIYGLQALGLTAGSAPLVAVEDMAAHYIREIRTLQPHGPYYLGGSSFGGRIAFEMARQFQDAGERIGMVALFDTQATGYLQLLPLSKRIHFRIQSRMQRASHHLSNILLKSPAHSWQHVKSELRTLQRRRKSRRWQRIYEVSKISGDDLPDRLRNVTEACWMARRGYKLTPQEVRVTLFRARKRPVGGLDDPLLGWGRFALGGVELHHVPGDHLTMLSEPQVATLADQLKVCLAQAVEAQGG